MLPRIKLVTFITLLCSNLVFVMGLVLPATTPANQPPHVNGGEIYFSHNKQQGKHIAINPEDQHPRGEPFGDEMDVALTSMIHYEPHALSLPEVSNSIEEKHGRPIDGKGAALSINLPADRSFSVRRCLRGSYDQEEWRMKRQRMSTSAQVAVRSGQEEPGFHSDYSSPRTHPPRNN